MNIDQSQTAATKAVLFDEKEYFIVRYTLNRGQGVQQRQQFFSALEIPTSQFADNHWMTRHLVLA